MVDSVHVQGQSRRSLRFSKQVEQYQRAQSIVYIEDGVDATSLFRIVRIYSSCNSIINSSPHGCFSVASVGCAEDGDTALLLCTDDT